MKIVTVSTNFPISKSDLTLWMPAFALSIWAALSIQLIKFE